MKVIVDLHIVKSHHFNAEKNTLWTSEQDQNHLVNLWEQLSASLKDYPNSMVAYEMMNEPVAPDAKDWNRLILKLHTAIRKLEPDRWLVIGSNMWQMTTTFNELEVPQNDKRIMLSFHFYEPFYLTHYSAAWVLQKDWKGKVRYPGYTFSLDDTLGLSPEVVQQMKMQYKFWDAKALDDMLQLPIEVSRKLNLPLYCGEWGCYFKAPMPDKLRWYQDMRRVFERHRIPWANWDYKGSFGLKKKDGTPADEILVVLLDAPIKR
jgi:endoglucanase